MLSFINRLVHDFEKEHGLAPNLLYLSPMHLHTLKSQLDSGERLDDLISLLGMEIIITNEAVHPHVVWSQVSGRRAV